MLLLGCLHVSTAAFRIAVPYPLDFDLARASNLLASINLENNGLSL